MFWFHKTIKKYNHYFALCFILCFIFCSKYYQSYCIASVKTQNMIDTEKLDRFVKGEMKAGNIPGLALGIVKDDQLLYLKGFGTAGPGKGKVTPQTPFILGSVSKSFTGLAVLQLAERGLLALEAPVKDYIPWFSIGGAKACSQITILQLLNHTSGIPAYAGNDSGVEKGNTLEERIRLKNNIKLSSPIGSKFEYSSLNYDILGLLVQQVSGIAYETYIQNNIFSPLNMNNSYVSPEEAYRNGLAVGYIPWFGIKIPSKTKYPMSAAPSGYITSSAEDMVHYLMAFTNQGNYKKLSVFSENVIMDAQTSIGETAYGAGWFSSGYYKWHTGELANYNAYVCTIPSNGYGIVMLSNTNDIGTKFINHESSSLRRIPDGIRIMLMGGHLPSNRIINTNVMYFLIDLAVIFILVLVIKLFLLPRKSKKAFKSQCICYAIKTAVSIITSTIILLLVPVWIKGSWPALMVSVPDLTLSALLFSSLLIISGIINTKKLVTVILLNTKKEM